MQASEKSGAPIDEDLLVQRLSELGLFLEAQARTASEIGSLAKMEESRALRTPPIVC